MKLKYLIQKLIYRDQVNSSTIQSFLRILITQPQIWLNSYELNKQPAHWINFKNAYYDVLTDELIEHDPKYLTINQIPFPYYPEDRKSPRGRKYQSIWILHTEWWNSRCSGEYFWILHDNRHPVPEIPDVERKWRYF